MIYFLSSDYKQEITDISAKNYGMFVMLRMAMGIFPVVIPIMVGGVVASLMQTGFLLTGEPLKQSLGKLNLLKGINCHKHYSISSL